MISISTKKPISKSWLSKNKFHYDTLLSDKECDCYTYRFPVYRWQAITTLEAEIKVFLQDNTLKLDVYDGQNRDLYAPYYYQEYGNYDAIMMKINSTIEEKLNKLGIEYEYND